MKIKGFKQGFQLLSDLSFSIFLFVLLALASSLGSVIEQDQPLGFYQDQYQVPIFGFVNSSLILGLGLDHLYTTPWFLFLIFLFALSLASCTVKRQFPLFTLSKEFFFQTKRNSYFPLAFSFQVPHFSYFQETLISKLHLFDFFLYQKRKAIYGYKGLLGRISPIFVHFSLLLILFGASLGAFWQIKAQEILPKGETFHIQNLLRGGWFSPLPSFNLRINDFWVEYENNQIHQFYSNLSLLNGFGKEEKEQTLSVNHPFRYQGFDFYQSDWNLIGIRVKEKNSTKLYQIPLFPLQGKSKAGITWIKENNQVQTLLLDQFQHRLILSSPNGNRMEEKNVGEENFSGSKFSIVEILSSTGLLIKSDPSLVILYPGFGLLMITTCLSYLPYTQIWLCQKKRNCWIGSSTNRGKLQVEMELETLIRFAHAQPNQLLFFKKE